MEASVTIHMTPEDLETMIERAVTRAISREPERLYTAKQIMEITGIRDYRTFHALGLQPKIRGSKKFYAFDHA